MDAVPLPVYLQSDRTPISQALAQLRQLSRGAIVLQDGSRLQLLFAGDLLRARAQGTINVQSVRVDRELTVIADEAAQERSLDLRNPFNSQEQYATYFNVLNTDYAVPASQTRGLGRSLGPGPGMAVVITRSETLGAALRMAGGYECDGEPRHYFPEPSVSVGERCPEYPLCSRSDGKIPTVRMSI
jgi:hypothetical protein